MDSYHKALIKAHLHIDAGARCFYKGEQIDPIMSGGQRKVLLPFSKRLWTYDELQRLGARVDVITTFSLAKAGGEGRWKEAIEQRTDRGIPSNVYVANARTINKAIEDGRVPPQPTWIGRRGSQMTEVRETVDEVVDDMANNRWRKSFSRGSRKGSK